MTALAMAWNGTLPTETGSPCSAQACSVRPIEAISGRVKVARGWFT